MQNLLHIRKSIGLSQTSLAAYLGISRQAYAKAEKDICSLNTENLIKLSRLHVCAEGLDENSCDMQLHLTAAEHASESRREKDCRFYATIFQKKLTELETFLSDNKRAYETVSAFVPADEGDELWKQKTKKDIHNKLDNCGPDTCMRLRKRICLLLSEADYIRNTLTLTTSTYEQQ